jgi:hypothetical protein
LRYILKSTEWWDGFIKYAIEMGSGVMIYVLSSVKDWMSHSNIDCRGRVEYADSMGIKQAHFAIFSK